MISFDGRQHGPCKDKEDATDIATMLAIKALAGGIEAQVFVEGADGKFSPLGSSPLGS